MKEAKFVSKNKAKWAAMERTSGLDADKLAANFIELTDDLSYARTFYPESEIVPYLNNLLSSYQLHVFNNRTASKKKWSDFWVTDFPLLLYKERKIMLFVFLFFFLSAIIGWFSAGKEESFVRVILGDHYVNQTIRNIEDGTPMNVYASQGEWYMFWAITINNIRVSFIAFVFGIIGSVGTLWVMFSNGIMMGSFLYFFYARGLLLHSLLSIMAHGTFEITSIIIAGGAGIVIGNSFLFPGTYSRTYSLKKGAMRGIKIIVGLIPFFIIAGAIESFITRYADAYPVVGAIAIGISLIGIILYFILYPFQVYRKTNLNEVLK